MPIMDYRYEFKIVAFDYWKATNLHFSFGKVYLWCKEKDFCFSRSFFGINFYTKEPSTIDILFFRFKFNKNAFKQELQT